MWRVFGAVLLILTSSAGTNLPFVVAAESLEEAEFAYERGEYTQAARLFSPLAEQGVVSAQFYLGLMHEKGRGVWQDYPTALTWFRMAAAQGYVGPQNNLGLMYERGRGVRKDLVRAFMWYDLAGAMLPGDDGKAALVRRDQLRSHMTAAQIEQAQGSVTRYRQSRFKQCD